MSITPQSPGPKTRETVRTWVTSQWKLRSSRVSSRWKSTLVDAQIDAHLVIHSVGGRIQAIQSQMELAGLGNRIRIIEKSPPNRRLAIAYDDVDVVVVPCRGSDDVLKSPFQILSAIRHHKCVVALAAAEHTALFGPAMIQAPDTEAAAQTLCELARDVSWRQRQESEARAWDERHPSGAEFAQILATL